MPIADSAEMARLVRADSQVIGIDEAQFFDAGLIPLVERLARAGCRLILAGLDQDYTGAPFEPMPGLLAVAEQVTKTLAICMRCGAPAGRSQRISRAHEQVVVGAADAYEARCRRCHEPRAEPQTADLFRPA